MAPSTGPHTPKTMPRQSKIDLALAYLKAHPEASRYEAAKHAGMANPAPLYARIKRDLAKKAGKCPVCGK